MKIKISRAIARTIEAAVWEDGCVVYTLGK